MPGVAPVSPIQTNPAYRVSQPRLSERVPVRRPKGQSERALHTDTRTTNSLIRGMRALGERAAAELKQRWRTLQHITISPSRIGDIARAALTLNRIWK
ncbi:transposase family protein [Streptomyces sp. NPDC087568]|uniref:transposase family protein n=1 Tax=Streptomyces sp. NPDC087568 TaxID=3365799 RepID=UPI003809A003